MTRQILSQRRRLQEARRQHESRRKRYRSAKHGDINRSWIRLSDAMTELLKAEGK